MAISFSWSAAPEKFSTSDVQSIISSPALQNLSEDQLVSGLKEALAKGVENAVTNLGRTNGFLKDAEVRIPLPQSLQLTEKSLRSFGQEKFVDEFETTLNHAAEEAVRSAGPVLGDAVRQMTIADAKSILNGTNMTAATDYFERIAGTNLYHTFLPIVQSATAKTGLTSTYKELIGKIQTSKLAGVLGVFGSLGNNQDALDLDAYVTRQALTGLFKKTAEEERRIRTDPAARTTELLQKVFGVLQRSQSQRPSFEQPTPP
jgi:hypothetical protein